MPLIYLKVINSLKTLKPKKTKSRKLKKNSTLIFLFSSSLLVAQSFSGVNKLPQPINTNAGDLAPTVSANGKVLVFQSNREGGRGSYDLYESQWVANKWSKPKNLKALNTKYFEAMPSLSADGQTLYFSSNRKSKDPISQDQDIYMSKRGTDGQWLKPRALNFLNSKKYDAKPAISFDGKTLYFVSLRAGGPGDLDIWYTKFINGKWIAPQPLPEPINSEYAETDPNLLAAGDQFYFASNRPGGQGSFDLYRMVRSRATDPWSTPKNIGKAINGKDNEYFFTLPATGDFIYISRGETNQEDIYKVNLPPELKPTPVVILKGVVKDGENNEFLGNIPVVFTAKNRQGNKNEVTLTSKEKTGQLYGIMIAGYSYQINVVQEGYEKFNLELDLKNLKRTYEKEIEIVLEREKEKVVPKFAGVYFKAFGCSLSDESKVSLHMYAEYLKENPESKIYVHGFSDIREGKRTKLKYSKRRVKRVKSYLKKLGIKGKRIKTGKYRIKGKKKDWRKYSKLQRYRTVTIELK